jgi:hypothetical protein
LEAIGIVGFLENVRSQWFPFLSEVPEKDIAFLAVGSAVVAASAAVVSLIVLILDNRRVSYWNRRHAAYDTLREVNAGKFADLLTEIRKKYEWDISRHRQTFSQTTDALSDATLKDDLSGDLVALLRIVESICVAIRHGILDEKLCRTFFNLMIQTIFFNSEDFIQLERERRNERRIFVNLEYFAKRWRSKSIW